MTEKGRQHGSDRTRERENIYRKARKAGKKEERRKTRGKRAAYTAEELEAAEPVDTPALLKEERKRRAGIIAEKMRKGETLTSVERQYAQDHASDISKALQNLY